MRDLFLSEKEYLQLAQEVISGKSIKSKDLGFLLNDTEVKGLREICKNLNEQEQEQFEMALAQYDYFDNDGLYFRDLNVCFVDNDGNDFVPTKNVVVALAKAIVLKNKIYEQILENGALQLAEKILKEV